MANYLNIQNYSRGIRNNNPGNLIYTPNNNWVGKIAYQNNKDLNKKFEQFVEMRYGIRAIMRDILNDLKNGQSTIISLISSYAPSFENNTLAYINTVAKMVGINVDAPIKKASKAILISLCKAIVFVENGKDANLVTSQDYEDAHAILNDTIVKKKVVL